MMKVETILISLMLGILFSFTCFAADGQLSFSDPSGNVGENITLNLKVKSDTPLSRADISLRYDGNALQFVSGTDTDGGAGPLRVHGSGDQSESNTLAYILEFRVLSAGASTINVEKQEVYTQDESLLNLTHVGASTVTATGGEAESAESASESASSETEESKEEKEETVNEGVKLTAKDKSITIMNPGSDVQVPAGFLESTIDVDGHQVKGWVWKAESDHQYIIIYGMNDAGDLNFYRYDLKEKTIQRYFQDPLEEEQKKNAESYPELLNRYDSLVGKFNMQFILSCVFGFLALLSVVLAAFLWQERNRLKRIIAFQKDNIGIDKKELRPNVEGISLKSFDKDEEKLDQTKMITSVRESLIEDDLEDEDLGATRAISVERREETKKKEEESEDTELEIEDL